jgi:hypothetical protein
MRQVFNGKELGAMVGSRALGVCIRKHRGHRTVQVLADALGKSARWLAYVEAGRAAPDWVDLIAITRMLGPVDGPIFLKEAVLLLIEEAEVARVKAEVMAAVQRREFLASLGLGATIDMERLGHALHGVGINQATVEELNKLSRWYAQQSRALAPAVMVSSLQAHLRDHFELIAAAPESVSRDLKASAAEVALLAGVLAFRLAHSSEAFHYWMLAAGLADESGHRVAQASAVAVQGTMAFQPSNHGGEGGDPKLVLRRLNQALEILGSKAKGLAVAPFHAWRAEPKAALGDAAGAQHDLEIAEASLANASDEPLQDSTGLGPRTLAEFAADSKVACAVLLQRPRQVLEILGSGVPETNPSSGWRSARMADLAAAHAQQGDHDHAATVLLEATDLALASGDNWRFRRLRGVRRRWLSDKLTGAVIGELDQKLSVAPLA